MEVKTFRAASLQEALERVRLELGPDAAVLETREVSHGVWNWLSGRREVEVLASTDAQVASRWVESPVDDATDVDDQQAVQDAAEAVSRWAARHGGASDFRARTRAMLAEPADAGRSLVEELCTRPTAPGALDLPESLFRLLADLVDAELCETLARELVERARRGLSSAEQDDYVLLKARILRWLEEQIRVTGPIVATPGRRRVVAVVGPTGVGKTTTIAKLAANFCLREQRRVGLATVDAYRVAAVEQLRAYADIIDLPLETAATPDELRGALERLSNLDLVLLDTGGRSPRDAARMQELSAVLAAAQPDEVLLVLSSVASASQLKQAAEQFARVGATSIVATKLDEAAAVGNLFMLLRDSALPLSYVTNGQNVPDDMEVADRKKLARRILAGSGANVALNV